MEAENAKWFLIGGLLLCFTAAVSALSAQWLTTAILGGAGVIFMAIGHFGGSEEKDKDDAGG